MNDDQTTYGVFANEEGELPLPDRKELSAKIREQARALVAYERAIRNVHALVRRMTRGTEIPGALVHLERFCVEAMPELSRPSILRTEADHA